MAFLMQRPPAPRTAFVTGASAGIGRALAERLAQRGTTVALAARRQDLLDEVRRAIEAKGGHALVVPVDVSRPEAIIAAMERADDELAGIDLVIANAGIGGNMHATKMTWAAIAPIFQLNVMGAIATLTALLPRMSARGRGHLVGVSSLAGMRGLPKTAPYSATKAALSTFLESLHVDLAGSGIFVTDVRPGYVKTDLTAGRSYKMPMLMELEEATEIILAGIDAGEPVVAFPKPLEAALAATRLLPRAGYLQLARKLIAR
jgi:short-subunit dehydrogenase